MMSAVASYPIGKQEAINNVSANGLLLSNLWATDADVVRAAIKNNPLAIRLASGFQDNFEMAKLAVSINGLAFLWISDNLKKDPELIALARKKIPRIYIDPCSGHPAKRRIFYISSIYCDPLRIISSFTDIYDVLVPVALQKDDCSIFIRDSRVVLFNGQGLIPHLIYDDLYRQLVLTMLPKTSKCHIVDPVTGDAALNSFGRGFYHKNVIQSEILSQIHRLPFKMGRVCIEGGNAFSFKINSRPFLLVGEMSLYLSLIALDGSHYFKGKKFSPAIEPGEEAYRIVKNLERYFLFRRPIEKLKDDGNCDDDDLVHFGGELGYRSLLLQPITEEEKPRFKERALKMEAFIQITLERMAKDTDTPIENVIVFPQKFFHLDLDTFVTPGGEVVIHDDEMAITLLNHLLKSLNLTSGEKDLLLDYLETATANSIRYKTAMDLRKEALKRKNIPYHLIPGSFLSKKFKSHLNYCNGVFVRRAKVIETSVAKIKEPTDEFIFITTGPTYPEENIVHDRIKKLFSILFPKTILREIPDLSKFISEMNGGFRCLSMESMPASEI